MLILTHRFYVQNSDAPAFEKKMQSRRAQLDAHRGFIRYRLTRTVLSPDATEYQTLLEWVDADALESWMTSPDARLYADAGLSPTALVKPTSLQFWEVLAEEVPGHRTDFRSVALDLQVEEIFAQESPVQRSIRERHTAQGLPPINIGAFEGRILEILLRANGSKRGVEVGTLGAYSSTWLAKALPADGQLITIEKDPKRAELARKNLAEAGLSAKVEVKVGAGRDVLETMNDLKDLDFVFIDADKSNYGHYVRWALPRLRKGGLVLTDNSYIWGGMYYYGRDPSAVPYPEEQTLFSFDKNAFRGMSEAWSELAAHPDFASIIFPTGEGLGIGVKI
ncbi:MAG: class I SAM-dependent methyltransferase [Bdellovibrionales bacterium]|nr:class I SAM-dependent methyltransferase [Bdellovibrionales bacterium]